MAALEEGPRGPGEESSPRGAHAAAKGAVSDPDQGGKEVDPEQVQKLPDVTAVSKKIVSPPATTGATRRRRSQQSPGLRKSPSGPSPVRISPWRSNSGNDRSLSSFNFSPRLLAPTPRSKRRSWCRSSLKGTKRRKSLPPVHQDVTELCKSISLELPETDRLSMLLLSSFQFSAQKFEHVLKETDGFSPEAFRANVRSVAEDLKRYVQKLKLDGTLKSCVEDPNGMLLDSALDESVAQIKEYIARFAAESQSWDQLLQRYQAGAEERARQLEESREKRGQAAPHDFLQTSQAAVLGTKPNYQQVLDDQGEVLSCMELVLDELQQAVRLLQAFSEDSRLYLQRLSEQLASRTFRRLENSPVRKLLAAPPEA
ncbi:kinetochore-associated protein DSN1 homolog [Phaenicophaeus curvirostris]|uniref:kinetochore-associated protein DSN1 homolog n=1 Tax=Phaenicophaeus curvirostris TaxID=33595 RepID=UPI0037F0DC8F